MKCNYIVICVAVFAVWGLLTVNFLYLRGELVKGHVIYSIGADRHNDGGREKPTNWKSNDKTNYDVTFAVER
jgi:hypothetical protein